MFTIYSTTASAYNSKRTQNPSQRGFEQPPNKYQPLVKCHSLQGQFSSNNNNQLQQKREKQKKRRRQRRGTGFKNRNNKWKHGARGANRKAFLEDQKLQAITPNNRLPGVDSLKHSSFGKQDRKESDRKISGYQELRRGNSIGFQNKQGSHNQRFVVKQRFINKHKWAIMMREKNWRKLERPKTPILTTEVIANELKSYRMNWLIERSRREMMENRLSNAISFNPFIPFEGNLS